MKATLKRVDFFYLTLLLVLTLLTSCSEKSGEAVAEVGGIPIFVQYKSEKVDLGLSGNEVIYDIIEVDGMLRATIGVLDPNWDPEHPEEYIGLPYPTEHRWYSLNYEEDTAKRQKTKAYQELAFPADPNVDFVFGGEYFEGEHGKGLVYGFYQDGEKQNKALVNSAVLEELGGEYFASPYSAMAQLVVYEGVLFSSINHGITNGNGVIFRETEGSWAEDLYIDDHFVNTSKWSPGDPDYRYCGMTGIKGVPYALLEIDDKGCLVPLTAETTEIIPEGTEIDGCPTGGAFTDGRFGYFMSGTELWRTDGKKSKCIIDLVPHGVSLSSMVRSVRTLSDGRLLVSVDGKLIELSESDGNDIITTCAIGVIDYHGEVDDLNLRISQYNDQAENMFFQVKEYKNVADLNLAVLSGDVDLVITPNKFILNNYVKQSLLASLEEVAPAMFEKDVLIESVVDAAKVDGVCYYLPVFFEICGESIYDPSLLKNGEIFETRQEYYDYIVGNDLEYFKNYTPQQILDTFTQDLDEWIDWENNTCHFDDGTFAALLEFCENGSTQEEITENFSAKTSLEVWWGREQKANSFALEDGVESYRFTDVKKALEYQKTLSVTEGVGGPATWVQVDFPMPSRVHDGYEIDAQNLYAVVDNEKTNAACADFLKWIILEDVEEEFLENNMDPYSYKVRDWEGFSINRDETDRYLRRLVNSYVDPEEEVAKVNPEAVAISPDTPAMIRYDTQQYNMKCGKTQYDATWDYIEKADHLRYYDGELHRAIRNEAQSYFSGFITAKQAAEYVQNRISIYLAEQG